MDFYSNYFFLCNRENFIINHFIFLHLQISKVEKERVRGPVFRIKTNRELANLQFPDYLLT